MILVNEIGEFEPFHTFSNLEFISTKIYALYRVVFACSLNSSGYIFRFFIKGVQIDAKSA